MHIENTSALQDHRQGRMRFAIAALVFSLTSLAALAATSEADQSVTTSSINRDPANDIRIQIVRIGQEGLELSARLAEDGGIIQLPVFWSVKRRGGETVYQDEEPVAHLAVEPGEYDVTVRYGTVTVSRAVTLLEGQHLGVNFVLNVGGLRILPKVANLGLPATRAETRVYATSGAANGRLVAVSTIPGEIVRLGAGAYRVESRFNPGNATEIASIEIEPGLMSAVELEMRAGVARLDAPRGAREVTWVIEPASGNALPPIASASAGIVLTPGVYTARARIDGVEKTATFAIASGETKEIILQP